MAKQQRAKDQARNALKKVVSEKQQTERRIRDLDDQIKKLSGNGS
ncbi:MAG: hypothetical protein ACFE0J_21050 [Elainellaceae cyanobacterium]